MDIVTLGAALNGSAEYVNSHFKGGSNIQIVDNPDGTQTINVSGEVSSKDTVARAEIAAIKDGETLDSFGDVETALGDKADTSTTYTKTEVDTALSSKQNTISDLSTIRSGAALGATAVQPVSGKGLSTNDYTNNEKSKLAGIEAQANKTTVDSALSGTSTNPVQNKVVKSALDGKQATLTTAQLAAVNSGITSTVVEQITTNKNNISSLYKVGSANILKNTAQTQVLGGVTFTINADGSITANGTKNNNDWLYLSTGNSLKAGTYVLSSGGVIGDDKLVIVTTGEFLGTAIMTTNTATGVYERELTQDCSGLYYAIRIANGTVCDNLLFKPMLCEKSVYEAINGEYQPYAMSNAEITAWILAHS